MTLSEHLARLARTSTGPAVGLVAVRGEASALLCRGAAAHTRFELGSVTKTFTGLLLAEMVARGEVREDEPIDGFLPPGALPRTDQPITMAELATHTSGLPRIPWDMVPAALPRWWTNPYEAYTPAHLERSLPRVRVRRGRRRYSNLGVGLLGHVLGRACGASYADALTTRVLTPLGLADTTADPEQPQALGHRRGSPRPPWRIPGLPGAGALRSSVDDMRRYLRAHLAPDTTPLRTALLDVARPRIEPGEQDGIGLVWNVRTVEGAPLLFHAGATRGFTAFVGYAPAAGAGLAALTNTTPTWRGDFVQQAYLALRELATAPSTA